MEGETTPSPTVTHYQQIAALVSAAITTALEQIAPLEAPHPTTRDFVRGHTADALQTLTSCAQLAIEHIDPDALVDALASTAVLLCAHGEYAAARSAIALAAHVAGQPGNEPSLPALHAGLAECAFLGYAPRHSAQPSL